MASQGHRGNSIVSMAQTSLRRSRLIDLSVVAGILVAISVSGVTGGAFGSQLFEQNEELQPLQISAGVGALCVSTFAFVLVICTYAMIPPQVQGHHYFGQDKWPLLGYAVAALSGCFAALLLIASLAMLCVATAATGHTVLLSLSVLGSVLLVLLACFLGESAIKALRIRFLYKNADDDALNRAVPKKAVTEGALDF